MLGVAGRGPEHELVQLDGHRRVDDAGRRHGVVGVLVGDLHGLVALVRLLAGQHLVEHDAEGVDVAAGVGDAPGHELGREVGDRAEQGRPGRRVGRRGAGQTEVADLDPAVVGEQDVLGLQVAVHDAGPVRRRETREHRLHDVHGLLRREDLVVLQQLAEGDPGQVLHDQVGGVVVLALIEDVDDVRVRQAGRRARLLDESLLERGVVGEVAVHDLDRDAALEAEVGGEVDRGHAAPRDP